MGVGWRPGGVFVGTSCGGVDDGWSDRVCASGGGIGIGCKKGWKVVWLGANTGDSLLSYLLITIIVTIKFNFCGSDRPASLPCFAYFTCFSEMYLPGLLLVVGQSKHVSVKCWSGWCCFQQCLVVLVTYLVVTGSVLVD